MASFVLSCCSTVDLTREHLERRNIPYVCFHYTVNGETHPDDLWATTTPDAFYTAVSGGAAVTTSQVNIGEYLDHFSQFLSRGLDVLHVCFSSGLSGAYQSAQAAASIARERFPERKLLIVDSLAASSGYGLMMDTLADLRDGGMGLEELYDWAMKNRLRLHHWFFSADLSSYVRGGRISKAAAIFGGLLNICPLLDMDADGRLTVRNRIRGKRRVIAEIVERMAAFADGGTDYRGKCFLSNSLCPEDAQAVAEQVEKQFPAMNGKVLIHTVGTVIGCHTGIGTVALFFWGKDRSQMVY